MWGLYFIWIYMLTCLGEIICQEVRLTPESVLASENEAVQLRCSYIGKETVSRFAMVYSELVIEGGDLKNHVHTWSINVVSSDNHVFQVGQFMDNKFIYRLFFRNQLHWTIKKFNKSGHGKWKCLVTVPSSDKKLSSNYVSITVKVPPDGPPTIEDYTDGDTYSMTENQVGKLICSSNGGNPLATLSWTCYSGQTTADGTSNTTVVSTRTWTAVRNTDRTCTCTSTHSIAGQQTATVNVQILYGPSISPMYNQSVEEGKTFRYTCPYTPGKPAVTTITWTRPGDNAIWNSEWLEIENVSRSEPTKYICTVQNIMEPTNMMHVTDPKSAHFYLKVKYKTSIEEFYVEDSQGFRHEVTVEEFSSPVLVCIVDSNPGSSIKVQFRNETLKETPFSRLQLTHQLYSVSYKDIGIYTCSGNNYLNTAPATRDVVVLVECRPQPYGHIERAVYSAQYGMATIGLSFRAYPEPSSTVWMKDDTNLTDSDNITITRTHVAVNESYIDIIQLSLVVHNVSVSDFGEYKLYIRNVAGLMEETFHLKVEENEDPLDIADIVVGVTVGGIAVVISIAVAIGFILRRQRAKGRGNSGPNLRVQYSGNHNRRHSVQNASTDTL